MKKFFKNIILYMLFAVMLLSLCACNKSSEDPVSEKTPEPTEEISEEAAETISEDISSEVEDKISQELAADAEPEPYGKRNVRYDTAWIDQLKSTLPELPDIDIESWEFKVANSYNCVTQYMPASCLNHEGQLVDARILDAVEDFIDAAKDAGYMLYISSGLRNFEYIKNHYVGYCKEHHAVDAVKEILPPGCNEHQTGLALDLTDKASLRSHYAEISNKEFLETDAYKWALEHCAEYGFINRYPEGKEEFYGTPCHCAGHFRYVGTEAAKFITENNLCLEEFVALYDPSLVFIPSKISD